MSIPKSGRLRVQSLEARREGARTFFSGHYTAVRWAQRPGQVAETHRLSDGA